MRAIEICLYLVSVLTGVLIILIDGSLFSFASGGVLIAAAVYCLYLEVQR